MMKRTLSQKPLTNSTIDTIAAPATAFGQAGVAVIRLSGPKALAIAEQITQKTLLPRMATFSRFLEDDGVVIDEGLAIFFPDPNSFTGEDVVELQGHGGPIVVDMLMRRILACGARMALPGEFSERAFLNDKLDLTQAEAISDLISASSEQAAKSAIRSLNGDFSAKIRQLVDKLISLRVFVEAAIDFPEEEIDFLSDNRVSANLEEIKRFLAEISSLAQQGALLRDGIQVVLAGKPNAGKSSLMNALSGQETAIVTDIAGTTRDVLRERITIDGMPLHVIDTAGLRETDNTIEQEGVRRAQREIEQADCVLFVNDVTDPTPLQQIEQYALNTPVIVVNNKIDLIQKAEGVEQADGPTTVHLSAKTRTGLDSLKQAIKQLVGFQQHTEGSFIARRRHLDALARASHHIMLGEQQLQSHRAGELLAEELRQAQQALNEITGEFTSDDLLGEIFSNFCIGK